MARCGVWGVGRYLGGVEEERKALMACLGGMFGVVRGWSKEKEGPCSAMKCGASGPPQISPAKWKLNRS